MKRYEIEDIVTKMFVYNDNHNWEGLASVFAPEVQMLHVISGDEQSHITKPEEIVPLWRSIMEKFDAVHHQIGNLLTTVENGIAKVSCHGTATHYKANAENGNIWGVIGKYTFLLKEIEGEWKIIDEVFLCDYQTGNLSLAHD
ncbi:MAG: nuclear transport factor 2 family protein [Marinifilaceae bacterium]|jgi:hypothetical protein|nr:nuclear transport factor 2 family protein [Marinifilaceae bacterium]